MPENKRKYLGKIELEYDIRQLEICKLKDGFEISETMNFDIEYRIRSTIKSDINLIINIIINSVKQEFKVIFKEAPQIIKNNKINSDIYPELISLYIYERDKNDKYNFRKINSIDGTEDPNSNIFITPFDIQRLNPISDNEKTKEIKFNIKSKDKKNKFYILENTGKFDESESSKS